MDHQYIFSSEWHQAGNLLINISGKVWVLLPWIEPWTHNTADEFLNKQNCQALGWKNQTENTVTHSLIVYYECVILDMGKASLLCKTCLVLSSSWSERDNLIGCQVGNGLSANWIAKKVTRFARNQSALWWPIRTQLSTHTKSNILLLQNQILIERRFIYSYATTD